MAKTLVINGANYSANKFDTVTFVSSVPCTGITLDQSTKSVTSMTAFTLVATPAPSNTTDAVSWSSSDTTVATVSDGVVTPLKLGTVTITATCGSYSASCAVTIDNVVPTFVAIAGYEPYRRATDSTAMTTNKKTSETSDMFIIAADQATGLYTIESKTDVDTSPYRFVPIMIPAGAGKIVVDTDVANFKTRVLFCDSTKVQTSYDTGIGAYCVAGSISGTWDQGSTISGPAEITIPDNVSGLDSCCFAIIVGSTGKQTTGSDCSALFTFAFARSN